MIAIIDNITSAHDDINNAAERIREDVQDLMKQVLSLDYGYPY